MSRAWLGFGLGLAVLATPLRLAWSHPGASPWWAFLIAAGLIAVAAWASRERT